MAMAYETARQHVANMYQIAFGRQPDPAGWEFHARWLTQQSGSEGEAINKLWDFMVRGPAGQIELRNNINALYRRVLGRDADEGGIQTYIRMIAHDRSIAFSQLGTILATSKEMRDRPPTGGQQPTTPPPVDPNASVKVIAQRMLEQFGLEHLAGALFSYIEQGYSTPDQWEGLLYDKGNPLGQAFHARFPQIELSRQNGLAPMNAREIVEYEARANELYQRAGLGFLVDDPRTAFVDHMAKRIDLPQLAERVNEGYIRAKSATPEVRAAFTLYFGVQGDQALASFFLDPGKAYDVWDRQLRMAEIGGAGAQSGFQLDTQVAEQLARMGYDGANSRSRFQALAEQARLFTESVGEQTDLRAEVEGIGAAFGTDAQALAEMERRRAGRVNIFRSSGGGVALTQSGVGGTAGR